MDLPNCTKGRGAQMVTPNSFAKQEISFDEGIIDLQNQISAPDTQFFSENAKTIVNKVTSPDLGLDYSMNPYQGCEHGCIYCYARNTHEYWGYSAGLDFEQKIIIKHNAEQLLVKTITNPRWIVKPIMLSGNTDCYQPVERKLQLTRKLLLVLNRYRHPVSVITKNALILRDASILKELAQDKLVHVSVSITTLNEQLRQTLEPRTVTAKQRLAVIEKLSKLGIPVNVMVAPIIPSLNSHEITSIIQEAASHGAISAGYTIVRLNGANEILFKDWIEKTYPDKSVKVLHQIAEMHGGQLNDSRFGVRMHGDGILAEMINSVFHAAKKKHMCQGAMPEYNLSLFKERTNLQLPLFK